MVILEFIVLALISYVVLELVTNIYLFGNKAFPKNMIVSPELKYTLITAAESIAISLSVVYNDYDLIYKKGFLFVTLVVMGAAAIIDFNKRIVPNKLVLLFIGLWALYSVGAFFISSEYAVNNLVSSCIGCLFSAIVFGLGYILMKNKLGGGDVKLTFAMGLALTNDIIFGALIYGLILSMLFAVFGLVTKKMKLHDTMPLVPFLFIGTALAIAVV